jgi:hypothetical protein
MILAFLRAFIASHANLAAENVLLRQQLMVIVARGGKSYRLRDSQQRIRRKRMERTEN